MSHSDTFSQRLCSAAAEGDSINIVKLIRRVATVDINARVYPYGGSALYQAAKGGHVEVVRLLLEAGADPNICDAIQVTPLHLAAQGGHVEVIKLLLLRDANVRAKTKNGMTPVDLAPYGSDCWKVLYRSIRGMPPNITKQDDVVPVIPRYCIPRPPPEDPDMGKRKKKTQKTAKR